MVASDPMPRRPARPPSEGGEVVVRPAATVMMVRDGDHDEAPLEVLMVRRNIRSDFVGGAHVFPGGALDPDDGGPEAAAQCTGRTEREASAVLGIPAGGLAYWVAALRECFEEAGLLLAERDDGRLLSLADPADARRFTRYRLDLNAGRRRFVELCRDEGLRLPLDRVHYFSHWITPVGAVRRYDTRFFVAAAPPDQVPAHDAAETIADIWLRPADALAQHRAGAIELIFPTVRTLQAIGRFATAGDLLAAAEAAAPGLAGRAPLLPRMVRDGQGSRLLLPGDPGYDEAADAPPVRGRAHQDAVRSVSRAANVDPGPGGAGPDLPAQPPTAPAAGGG